MHELSPALADAASAATAVHVARAADADADAAPPRHRNWGQPHDVEEPIIDASRIPLSAYGGQWSTQRKWGTYVWLRLVRPLFTVAVWLAGLLYTWAYLTGAPVEPETERLLWLYAMIISGIFLLMLMMAPLRRMRQPRATQYQPDSSTLMALADYIQVPPEQLSRCQRAPSLLVRHNRHGRLRAAVMGGPDTTQGGLRVLRASRSRSRAAAAQPA